MPAAEWTVQDGALYCKKLCEGISRLQAHMGGKHWRRIDLCERN